MVLTYTQHPGEGKQCDYRTHDWDPAFYQHLKSFLRNPSVPSEKRREESAAAGPASSGGDVASVGAAGLSTGSPQQPMLLWFGDINVSGLDPQRRDFDIGGNLSNNRPNNL